MNKTDRKRFEAVKEEISSLGYELRFVDYIEDTEHPGICGFANGLTDKKAKVIKVRRSLLGTEMLKVLEHELQHANGKRTGEINDGLRCLTWRVL